MLTYGFFNSSNGDRKYTAEQMSDIFDQLLTEGVLETYGNKYFTIPQTSGLGVIVRTGWAWFDQTWTKLDADQPFQIDVPDLSLSRIDTVAIVTNKSELTRANSIQILKGTPSVVPTPVVMEDTATVHTHPIAYVTVRPEATQITAADIEILVGKAACPFITSILQATDITTLFANWEQQFDTWFENIQEVLSEDVITNLQLQIDQRVKISDKATTAEAQAGTDDTKWMTPAKVKSVIEEKKYNIGDTIISPIPLQTPDWLEVSWPHNTGIQNPELYEKTKGWSGNKFNVVKRFNLYEQGASRIYSTIINPDTGEICLLCPNSVGTIGSSTPLMAIFISPSNAVTKLTTTTQSGVLQGYIGTAPGFYFNNTYWVLGRLSYNNNTCYLYRITKSNITMTTISFGSSNSVSNLVYVDVTFFNGHIYIIRTALTGTSSSATSAVYFVMNAAKISGTTGEVLSTGSKQHNSAMFTAYSSNVFMHPINIGGYVYIRFAYMSERSGSDINKLALDKDVIINIKSLSENAANPYEIGQGIFPDLIEESMPDTYFANTAQQTIFKRNNPGLFRDSTKIIQVTDAFPSKNIVLKDRYPNTSASTIFLNQYGFSWRTANRLVFDKIRNGISYQAILAMTRNAYISGTVNDTYYYEFLFAPYDNPIGTSASIAYYPDSDYRVWYEGMKRAIIFYQENNIASKLNVAVIVEDENTFIPPVMLIGAIGMVYMRIN